MNMSMKPNTRLERAIKWADNSPAAMIAACSILGLGLGVMLYLAF